MAITRNYSVPVLIGCRRASPSCSASSASWPRWSTPFRWRSPAAWRSTCSA
ncbi:MAG: hypothetical protein M0C28_43990 [Candidatus Moduliflexus flocculans]|nr:hypothetical protein [Candidatus Moduliflexus flocculans]